ncbi:hypothetical protein E1B28_003299 [Marasmius oreades]|uniref:C2H2-type domain-containing protein n=1 Tax=Marasmius oreades TaxID=181124 RepID=A0A9P7UM90_9AGAR|nr:uncharacterized protein E1B28_003299 [Marasmius oreades]KAG7085756.1 hypothetical protein E1B28_003299 [Marasmius oreades]
MNASHPKFFPGTFNDPSMSFFPPVIYDKGVLNTPMVFSPSYGMQSEQQLYKNHYYQGDPYPQVQQPSFDLPSKYSNSSSLSREWQSWSPSTSLADPHPSSSQSSQPPSECSSHGVSSHSGSKLSLLSWPVECFVTPDPSLASNDNEILSGAFSLFSSTGTPDLHHSTTSSIEDGPNVFDIQFGQSLQASTGAIYGHPGDSPDSSSNSAPPSPVSRETMGRRRQTQPPPSSPSSDTTPPFSADYRRRFPCLLPGCERRFTSRYTLKVHMEAHKPKPKVTFPCTHGCSERFSRQHDRLRHEVAKHGKVCEFSCDDCGRFFSTGKTLGNHKCPVAVGGTRWVHSN